MILVVAVAVSMFLDVHDVCDDTCNDDSASDDTGIVFVVMMMGEGEHMISRISE